MNKLTIFVSNCIEERCQLFLRNGLINFIEIDIVFLAEFVRVGGCDCHCWCKGKESKVA